MYYILTNKDLSDLLISDNTRLLDIEGFSMESRKKSFLIKGSSVTKIKVINKEMANSIVSKKVFKKYERLINKLTELLIDDDDSGDSCREALNQIEKFRLEIKIKYRHFLKKKELEKMSKQLVLLQKEANRKLIEIHNSYMEYNRSSNHK